MNIYLGISLSKKNYKNLKFFLNSLNKLSISKNYKLIIILVLEKKDSYFKNLINRRLKKRTFKILYIRDKSGIPESRNAFLNYVKNRSSKYIGFLDDDCEIPKDWLLNMIKFIKNKKCDVVGGPQHHKVKNPKFSKFFKIIEPKRKHNQSVDWIATNNAFLKTILIKKNSIFFDNNLKNVGGSDQLFFKKLKRLNNDIRWNLNSFVIENYNKERENLSWFLKRNLRYGYSGNLIDQIVYGKIIGGFLSLFKSIYFLALSLIYLLQIYKYENLYKSIFFVFRFFGRILGLLNYTPKKYI